MFFIQARYKSSRLPGKVLLPLRGSTVLKFLIDRITQKFPSIKTAVLTGGEGSEIIKLYCDTIGVNCIVGSENNLQTRFQKAVDLLQPEYFIRLTADNPVINLDYISDALQLMDTNQADAVSTRWISVDNKSQVRRYYGLPKGHNFDCFHKVSFNRLFSEKSLQCSESKEHLVTHFLLNHPYSRIEGKSCWPLYHETIDTYEDYIVLARKLGI